jgi:Ribbon-helix-helix protein, copG family.
MPVISVRIDKKVYEALQKLAREKGVSLYEYVKTVLETHVSSQVSGEVSAYVSSEVSGEVSFRDLVSKLSELTTQLTGLKERIDYLERKLSELTSKQTTSSSSTSTASSSSEKVVTKCVEKSKIKNIRAYVEKLKERGVLVDWWEDLEEYCFELKSSS